MLLRLTNKDKSFYKYMEYFFKENELINYAPLKDLEEKVWYIKLNNIGDVMGFASVIESSICSCYVVNEYRRMGIMELILRHILFENKGHIDVVCNFKIMPLFQKLDFTVKKIDSGWFYMEQNNFLGCEDKGWVPQPLKHESAC